MARKLEDFKQNNPEGYAKKMKQKEEAAAAESAKLANEAAASPPPSNSSAGQQSTPNTSSYFTRNQGILAIVVGVLAIGGMLYAFHKNKQSRTAKS